MSSDFDEEDELDEDEEYVPPKPEKRKRGRRIHPVLPKTVSIKQIEKEGTPRVTKAQVAELDELRPKKRHECENTQRPCPFVACRYHLFIDVNEESGSLQYNWPDIDPDQIPQTCSLDVADQGGATLEAVAEVMNVTRERIRQIEAKALAKVKAAGLRLRIFEER